MNWHNAGFAAAFIAVGLVLSTLGTIALEWMKHRFGEGVVMLGLLAVLLIGIPVFIGLAT